MLHSMLPWWLAGPILGLVIVALIGLGNSRFGMIGGITDLVGGSLSWRALLVLGVVLGGAAYAVLGGAPDAGIAYSWLDAHLSATGEVVVLYERSAGTSLCSAYHPPDYVHRRLAEGFDVVAFRPAGDDGRHDIHLLRKPARVAAAS